MGKSEKSPIWVREARQISAERWGAEHVEARRKAAQSRCYPSAFSTIENLLARPEWRGARIAREDEKTIEIVHPSGCTLRLLREGVEMYAPTVKSECSRCARAPCHGPVCEPCAKRAAVERAAAR